MKSVILFLLCAIACVATGDDITAATIHGGTVADGYQAGAYANIGTSDYNGYMAVLNNSRTAFFAEQFGTGAAALFAGHNPAYYAVGITSTAPNGAPALRVETQLRTDTAISVNGNIDASGQTVTAAKFNGDASTVSGHAADIVTFESAQTGQTCTLAGYLVLHTIGGGTAKVPFCQ